MAWTEQVPYDLPCGSVTMQSKDWKPIPHLSPGVLPLSATGIHCRLFFSLFFPFGVYQHAIAGRISRLIFFFHSWSYKEWYRMNLTLSLQIYQHSSQDEAQVRNSRGVYMGTGAFIIS